jgi:hypothetical protein
MDWMIKRLNGTFVASEFLPITNTGNTTFKWHYKGHYGGMTPEVGENDAGDYYHTVHEERVARTRYYRERVQVSCYVQPQSNIIAYTDLVQDDLEDLTERGALRLEYARINAIQTAAYAGAAHQNRFWINQSVLGGEWVGGAGSVSIINDIVKARKNIGKYGKIMPDTLLCGPDIAEALITNVETKDWDRKGPMALELARLGMMNGIGLPTTNRPDTGSIPITDRMEANIGKLAGCEVFVSNATLLTDQENPRSQHTPILDDDVYIFKRGTKLGRTVFFETPEMRSKPEDIHTDTQDWQYRMSFTPVVYRPQLIFHYSNCIA